MPIVDQRKLIYETSRFQIATLGTGRVCGGGGGRVGYRLGCTGEYVRSHGAAAHADLSGRGRRRARAGGLYGRWPGRFGRVFGVERHVAYTDNGNEACL